MAQARFRDGTPVGGPLPPGCACSQPRLHSPDGEQGESSSRGKLGGTSGKGQGNSPPPQPTVFFPSPGGHPGFSGGVSAPGAHPGLGISSSMGVIHRCQSESPLASSSSASCCSASRASTIDPLHAPAPSNVAVPEKVRPSNLEPRQSAARLCRVSGLLAPLCILPPRRSQNHPPTHTPEPRGNSVTQVKPPLDWG